MKKRIFYRLFSVSLSLLISLTIYSPPVKAQKDLDQKTCQINCRNNCLNNKDSKCPAATRMSGSKKLKTIETYCKNIKCKNPNNVFNPILM